MRDLKEHRITAVVHLQVVHDGVDALLFGWDLLIGRREKVDEMLGDAPGIALRPAVAGGFPTSAP